MARPLNPDRAASSAAATDTTDAVAGAVAEPGPAAAVADPGLADAAAVDQDPVATDAAAVSDADLPPFGDLTNVADLFALRPAPPMAARLAALGVPEMEAFAGEGDDLVYVQTAADPTQFGLFRRSIRKVVMDGSKAAVEQQIEVRIVPWIAWRSQRHQFIADGKRLDVSLWDVTLVTNFGATYVIEGCTDEQSLSPRFIREKSGAPVPLPSDRAALAAIADMLAMVDAAARPTRTAYAKCGWEKINGKWTLVAPAGSVNVDGPVPGLEVVNSDLTPVLDFPLGLVGWPKVASAAEVPDLLPMIGELLDTQSDGSCSVFVALLGTIAASHLGLSRRPPMILEGTKGSGKSLAASWAQTALLAGRPTGSVFPVSVRNSSPAGAASTLRWMGDVTLFADDYKDATTSGRSGADTPSAVVERIVTGAYGEGGEAKSTVTGARQQRGEIRAGLVVTGEKVPTGSTLERLIVAHVVKGRTFPEVLTMDSAGPLDVWRDRWASAGWLNPLWGSFIQWIAELFDDDRAAAVEMFEATKRDAQTRFAAARAGEGVGQIAVGWAALRMWAAAHGCGDLLPSERRISQALQQLLASSVAQHASASPQQVLVNSLMQALQGEGGHLTDREGGVPADRRMRRAFNWTLTSTPRDPDERWQPRGRRLGWHLGETVAMVPAEVMRLIRDVPGLSTLSQSQVADAVLAAGGTVHGRPYVDGKKSGTRLWELPAAELGLDATSFSMITGLDGELYEDGDGPF